MKITSIKARLRQRSCNMNTAKLEKIVDTILKPYKDFLYENQRFYVFGAKILGQQTMQHLLQAGFDVRGFIDNNASLHGTQILGKKVFAPSELAHEKDSAVIVIASEYFITPILKQLQDSGYKKILPSYILNIWNKTHFPAQPIFQDMIEDYIENKNRYAKVRNALTDEKSKTLLDKLLEFRQTMNYEIFLSIGIPEELQYFDDEIVKLSNDEVLINGGGFDGNSTLRFIKAVNNKYKCIYFFEPDLNNMALAKQNLKNAGEILFHAKGLSDTSKTLRFDSRQNPGSAFSESGNTEIKCVALDDVVAEDKGFIKLDIEGAELDCLKGAKRLIKNGSTLAISVYHKPRDIWEIYEYITSVNPNYNFYLRHYTTTVHDTVLYAIPK